MNDGPHLSQRTDSEEWLAFVITYYVLESVDVIVVVSYSGIVIEMPLSEQPAATQFQVNT